MIRKRRYLQRGIMRWFDKHPDAEASTGELSRALGRPPGNLSHALSRLVGAGLLKRRWVCSRIFRSGEKMGRDPTFGRFLYSPSSPVVVDGVYEHMWRVMQSEKPLNEVWEEEKAKAIKQVEKGRKARC